MFNLPLNKDERRLIYRKLDFLDWCLGRIAHNPRYEPGAKFLVMCLNRGYFDLLRYEKRWKIELFEYYTNEIRGTKKCNCNCRSYSHEHLFRNQWPNKKDSILLLKGFIDGGTRMENERIFGELIYHRGFVLIDVQSPPIE